MAVRENDAGLRVTFFSYSINMFLKAETRANCFQVEMSPKGQGFGRDCLMLSGSEASRHDFWHTCILMRIIRFSFPPHHPTSAACGGPGMHVGVRACLPGSEVNIGTTSHTHPNLPPHSKDRGTQPSPPQWQQRGHGGLHPPPWPGPHLRAACARGLSAPLFCSVWGSPYKTTRTDDLK